MKLREYSKCLISIEINKTRYEAIQDAVTRLSSLVAKAVRSGFWQLICKEVKSFDDAHRSLIRAMADVEEALTQPHMTRLMFRRLNGRVVRTPRTTHDARVALLGRMAELRRKSRPQ